MACWIEHSRNLYLSVPATDMKRKTTDRLQYFSYVHSCFSHLPSRTKIVRYHAKTLNEEKRKYDGEQYFNMIGVFLFFSLAAENRKQERRNELSYEAYLRLIFFYSK